MSAQGSEVVIAVDPGRSKCGLAVVRLDGTVVARAIVDVASVCDHVRRYVLEHRGVVIVGNGTGSQHVRDALRRAGCEVEVVDEQRTSELARRRYLAEHPEKGWRRFIPIGLRCPREPYDDYVALILAERRIHEWKP